jgi:hypothetical protein
MPSNDHASLLRAPAPRSRRRRSPLLPLLVTVAALATSVATPAAASDGPFDVRLNVGSSTSYTAHDGSTWRSEAGLGGGSTHRTTAPIAGTKNAPLYQKHRWGLSGHRVAVPCPATYRVAMHFAETVFTTPGRRVFDVAAEGQTRLRRLDVQAQAGTNRALTKRFDVVVGDGILDLTYGKVVEDPMVSAVRITKVTSCVGSSPVSSTPEPASAARFQDRINTASSSALLDRSGATWRPDAGFIGGSTHRVTAAIAGTEDDALYQKHRWGLSGYRIAVPCAATYRVGLHFAETVFTTKGRRVFDVGAEGTTRISRLDVQAVAGTNTALVKTFDVGVSDGALDVSFSAVVEDPMLSGIEVAQVGECGATAAPSTTTTTTAPRAVTTTTSPPPTTTTAPPATTTTAPPAPTTTTTVAPAPAPATAPGAMPTPRNTGPRVEPTETITPAQALAAGGATNKVITGPLRLEDWGGAQLGKTLTFKDCVIRGSIRLIFDNGTGASSYPLDRYPTVNIDGCRIEGSFVSLGAYRLNMDRTHVTRGAGMIAPCPDCAGTRFSLEREMPFDVRNSLFVSPPGDRSTGHHYEAAHIAGSGQGYRFTNTRFVQEGPTTGTETAALFFHGGRSTFDGCYFDDGDQGVSNAYHYTVYAYGRGAGATQNVVRNSAIERGMASYVYPGGSNDRVVHASYQDNRDFHSGARLALP